MGVLLTYFRTHPWQRRLLTLAVAMVIGAVAGLLLVGPVRNLWIIHDLGSQDPNVRQEAIRKAYVRAQDSPDMLQRLNDALDTPDDTRFYNVALVLRLLNQFDTIGRKPIHLDRLRRMQIQGTHSQTNPDGAARTRRELLILSMLTGRDNAEIRRMLDLAVGDESPIVRSLAPAMACRMERHDLLDGLLSDANGLVRGLAAYAAGVSGRSRLAPILVGMLDGNDVEAVSGAAAGLARLDANTWAGPIGQRLREANDPDLSDRLLWLAAGMPGQDAEPTVRLVLAKSDAGNGYPRAMALLAAERFGVSGTGQMALAVLDAAAGETVHRLQQAQVIAACEVAQELRVPARRQANAIVRDYWSPQMPLMLARAVRLLGAQAALPDANEPNAVSAEDAVTTLRQVATYDEPNAAADAPMSTALPSAQAAVELWKLQPSDHFLVREDPNRFGGLVAWRRDANSSAFFVYAAVRNGSPFAGDYIAWHLGVETGPMAMGLAYNLLPALDAPVGLRMFDKSCRQAGAVMLGAAWRTAGQKAEALRRVRRRLVGGALGGEQDPYTRGAYQCALLMLGEANRLEEVRSLFDASSFPHRRAATALLVAGDRWALDQILADPRGSCREIVESLVEQTLGEVVAATCPELPAIEPAGGADLRLWQARLIRTHYLVRRERLAVGLRR